MLMIYYVLSSLLYTQISLPFAFDVNCCSLVKNRMILFYFLVIIVMVIKYCTYFENKLGILKIARHFTSKSRINRINEIYIL